MLQTVAEVQTSIDSRAPLTKEENIVDNQLIGDENDIHPIFTV
jgi:hypothetical protein